MRYLPNENDKLMSLKYPRSFLKSAGDCHPAQGAVSRKSRNFTGHFRVSQFPFVTQERRAFNSSNFTVIFLFVNLKTC